MPHGKHSEPDSSHLPATEAAALAALSVSESLILAMIESGSLDPRVLRRCLLDALTAHDQSMATERGSTQNRRAVHSETVKLIDRLLQQVEAVAPSQPRHERRQGFSAAPD